MTSHTLQTLIVTTVGDDIKTEAKIDRGLLKVVQLAQSFSMYLSTHSPMY